MITPKEKFIKNKRAQFRFDSNYERMLNLLAAAHGLTKTAVVEMAIQDEYKKLTNLSKHYSPNNIR